MTQIVYVRVQERCYFSFLSDKTDDLMETDDKMG